MLVVNQIKLMIGIFLANNFFGLEVFTNVLKGCLRNDNLTSTCRITFRLQCPNKCLADCKGFRTTEHATYVQ